MKDLQKTGFTLILFIIGFTSIFTQASLDSLSRLDYPQSLNDIWGYTDSAGNEYALVGTTTGVSIVDVTIPTNPIEKIFIPGIFSNWRDLKAWKDYAYVTNESGNGLMIIDLSDIQNGNAPFINSDCGVSFSAAHNIYIDEFGVAYLFGSRDQANNPLGTIMVDVNTADPLVPNVLGYYTDNYVHDGMVRNNIMYTSEINVGQLALVDVNNKAAPMVLGSHPTLSTTTHAVWISDDANFLFSMDEVNGSFVESFDISNPANIQRLDIVQSSPGSGTLPHNLFYYNGFLVTSYYRDGVVIFDASRPHNLIEVASYDTYPEGSGGGSPGCWGVYPYFASGNIVASDIQNGLFVLGPTYTKACYLEGTVTESATGDPISNAIIQIIELPGIENSGVAGNYATGTSLPGTYTVFVGKGGFLSKQFNGVMLDNGIVTTLDVELDVAPLASVSGVVNDDQGNPIENALVNFSDPILGLSYDGLTNVNGEFNLSMYEGNYEATFGKWGYITDCEPISVSGTTALEFTVIKGYYDDFSFDFGWSVAGNATTGIWERGEPIGTTFDHDQSNPDFDVNGDCIDQCYVTGNGGGFGGDDDVDSGNTVLSSPNFDLIEYCNPYISFYTWFFNGGGNGAPLDDTLIISITNGSQTEELVRYDASFHDHSSWVFNEFKISDFITPTMTMSLIVETYDLGFGHIVEGGLDIFNAYDGDLTWYADLDDDGYSDGTTIMAPCQPTGYKALAALSGNGSEDCNDDPNDGGGAINPEATEICDGLDNDCDALVDDNDPSITGQMNPYYPDTDGDGYGSGSPDLFCATNPPDGYSANNEDCNPDDGNLTIPGNSCDDGKSYTEGDFINEECECIGGFIVPTLTQWGIITLSLIMLIIGLVVVRKQRYLTT